MIKILGMIVAALLLAACGSTVATPKPPSASQQAASVARQDNLTACQHYKVQRAAAKALVYPTLADVTKFVVGLATDTADAAPGTPLDRELTIMLAGEQKNIAAIGNTGAKTVSVEAISEKVLAACEALGVTF
jgi:hypothetical protein